MPEEVRRRLLDGMLATVETEERDGYHATACKLLPPGLGRRTRCPWSEETALDAALPRR